MFQPNSGRDPDSELSEYPPIVQAAAKYPRIAGLIFFAFGALITKFFIVDEYNRIRATHPDSITLDPSLIIVSYALSMVGVAYLVWGRKAVLFLAQKKDERGRYRPLQLVIAFIIVGIGAGLYFWFQNQLSMLGYRF